MSLNDNINILAQLPIFSNLEPEALRLIAFAAETRAFRAGDLLFRQGEISDGGQVLISGAVALDASQNAAKAGKIVGPGALLGELSLLVATKNSATAIARQNTKTLKVSRAMFLRTLEESPVSAGRLKRLFSRQLETFAKELEGARRRFLD